MYRESLKECTELSCDAFSHATVALLILPLLHLRVWGHGRFTLELDISVGINRVKHRCREKY